MTFEEWYEGLPSMSMPEPVFARFVWDNAKRYALEEAADRFEGTLPFNWVCADGYANGFDVGGELRFMAQESSNKE